MQNKLLQLWSFVILRKIPRILHNTFTLQVNGIHIRSNEAGQQQPWHKNKNRCERTKHKQKRSNKKAQRRGVAWNKVVLVVNSRDLTTSPQVFHVSILYEGVSAEVFVWNICCWRRTSIVWSNVTLYNHYYDFCELYECVAYVWVFFFYCAQSDLICFGSFSSLCKTTMDWDSILPIAIGWHLRRKKEPAVPYRHIMLTLNNDSANKSDRVQHRELSLSPLFVYLKVCIRIFLWA